MSCDGVIEEEVGFWAISATATAAALALHATYFFAAEPYVISGEAFLWRCVENGLSLMEVRATITHPLSSLSLVPLSLRIFL
jgi:hypothetical protein